jgi:AbiV family abortive infection protein
MKKFNAYRGKLSPGQAAAGMNAATNNACRLAADAAALVAAGRFPTAASIAALAIEEAGKISILRALVLAKSDKEILDGWRGYRSHIRKNVMWLLPQLVADGARKLDDFRPLFDRTSDHPSILDQVKQLGFYTDCLGEAHWSIPMDVIDEGLAHMLVKIAQLLARDHKYTEKELELWVEHVGPVWKKDASWMKQAVVNWFVAMQEAGLIPEGPNEMEHFIHTGLGRKEV